MLTSDGGKSYFGCIWQEGVLKTDLFKSHYNEPCKNSSSSRSAAIAAWVEDGRLESVFAGEAVDDASGRLLKDLLKDAIMDQRILSNASLRQSLPFLVEECGARTFKASVVGQGPETESPAALLGIAETTTNSSGIV